MRFGAGGGSILINNNELKLFKPHFYFFRREYIPYSVITITIYIRDIFSSEKIKMRLK
jgi:hypothetical protein